MLLTLHRDHANVAIEVQDVCLPGVSLVDERLGGDGADVGVAR